MNIPLARHNSSVFHASPDKPTKKEKTFLRVFGKVVNSDIHWSQPITTLPIHFHLQRCVAPYIAHRRKMIKEMCDAGTLTPRTLLRCIEHFQPIKEDDEQRCVWCLYTYVDAKYDFLPSTEKTEKKDTEKTEKKDTEKTEKKDTEKQSGALQNRLDVNKFLRGIVLLDGHAVSFEKCKELFEECKKRRLMKATNCSADDQNNKINKRVLFELKQNIRRVIKSRLASHCPLLCDTHDYDVVFVKDCATRV